MSNHHDGDKEHYYRYGLSHDNWLPKEPDVLSYDVVEMMKREGIDDRYRFVWMGAAVMRKHGQDYDPNPVVLGDPRACIYVDAQVPVTSHGATYLHPVKWLVPRDFFVRRAVAGHWCWFDDDGVPHTADRPDQLITPEGKPVVRRDYLFDLGHLHWTLQFRLTGEQMVDGKFCNPADAPNEYWQTIQTFRNPTGGYLAPTVLDVESMILKREYENRNLSTGEMRALIQHNLEVNAKRKAEHDAAAEALDNEKFHEFADSVAFDHARKTSYGLPAQRR